MRVCLFRLFLFFFSSRRRHTRYWRDWSSDVCSSDLSRLVRAEVLSLREREFVAAARALGAGAGRVIFRHVLPNAAAPIIVSAALGIGHMMLLEAGLSFLGMGVPSPTPSWGNMIADGWHKMAVAWWSATFPGLAISLVVMALNAVGDALRDALDPRREAV